MITFKRDKDGFEFELTLYPKCWWLNHNYGKYGEPYKVYSGDWKQSRVCLDCGKVTTRNIGFNNVHDINVPKEIE